MVVVIVARDDEHRTCLMLAARHGHAVVMKILLENQSNVNDVDKNKVGVHIIHNCLNMNNFFSQNTALHFACAGGHLAAVELLIDQRADVTIKNTHDATPLDLAIDNLHLETATCMLRSRKCARN